MSKSRRKRLLLTVAVLAHLAILPGGWLAMRIGRPEFFGLVVYASIAVVVFDIALIVSKVPLDSPTKLSISLSSLLDWRSVVVAYCVAVASVALYGNGVWFYLIMVGSFLALVFRIQASDYTSKPIWPDLALIVCGSTILLATEVLPVAYYASTNDTLGHTARVIRVLRAGGLSGLVGTRYINLPMLHFSGAIGVEVTGLDPRMYLFVFTAVIFEVALIASILFFRNVGVSPNVVGIGAVLLGTNVYFIEWGTQAHAQSLSFVFYCFLLYSITVRATSKRYLVPVIVLMLGWIFTHHFSVVVGIVLVAPLIGVAILSSVTSWLPRFDRITRPRYGLIFSLAFLSYWSVVTRFIRVPFQWIFLHSPAAESVDTRASLVRVYSSLDALVEASMPFVIDNLHFAFLLAMTGLGVWYVIGTDWITKPKWQIALIAFPTAAFFYFPNPGWLPLRGAVAILRWGIMTLPLLVLVPVVGIKAMFERTEAAPIRRSVVSALVFVLLFTTIATGMSAPSLTDLAGYNKEARDQLSHDELAAIEFIRAYRDAQDPIYGPVLTKQYIYRYEFAERLEATKGTYDPAIRQVTASGIPGQIQYQPGLTVFPSKMFADEIVKVRVSTAKDPQNPSTGSINRSVPASSEQVRWSTVSENLVYSNGATFVQHVPTAESEDEEL